MNDNYYYPFSDPITGEDIDEIFDSIENKKRDCDHEWVNVSFNFVEEICKHCKISKKEWALLKPELGKGID